MELVFFEGQRQKIEKIIDYANDNIYQLDDILDMMNGEIATPGEDEGHWVLVGEGGLGICYYLVDHPNKGRCHYFHLKSYIPGEILDKSQMEYIVKEFGIDTLLLDERIKMNNKEMVIDIVLPLNS